MINKISYDTKTSLDRIADQSLKTLNNRLTVLYLSLVILATMLFISFQVQAFLQSFHTNHEAMQAKFYPIANTPTFKIVISTNTK